MTVFIVKKECRETTVGLTVKKRKKRPTKRQFRDYIKRLHLTERKPKPHNNWGRIETHQTSTYSTIVRLPKKKHSSTSDYTTGEEWNFPHNSLRRYTTESVSLPRLFLSASQGRKSSRRGGWREAYKWEISRAQRNHHKKKTFWNKRN